jgi:Uma2 family endonuclease
MMSRERRRIGMAEAARRRWTLAEFLAFDDGTDRRYELFDGEIVAMAPTSHVQGALVARLAVGIGVDLILIPRDALKGRGAGNGAMAPDPSL